MLRIEGPLVASDTVHGASIAVNGVCLTVTDHDADGFTVDVMAETLSRSSLGALRTGDRVNLERAMPADGRFGGHVVQGHVDGTATVTGVFARRPVGDGRRSPSRTGWRHTSSRRARSPWTACRSPCPSVGPTSFCVSLIPITLELTTLGRKGVGDLVNLEVDVLAKYVERLLVHGPGTAGAVDTKEES